MKRILRYSLIVLACIFMCASCTKSQKTDVAKSSVEKSEDAQSGATEWVDGLPTVIDFYATWCGPCKMISPLFDELQEEYAGKVNFVRIDIDKQPQKADSCGVEAVPTFVFLDKDGNEVNRLIGADEELLRENVATLAKQN